jgi:putative oxidoreductase
MAGMDSTLESWARSCLRLVAGFTFTEHGFQKVFGMFGGLNHHGATAHLFSLFWFAGLIESIGGPLIFFGLFTRPVAFILSGEMAVAYFYAHFPRSFWPLVSGGELAMLYCFIFLYLAATGPGPLSIDRLIRKGKA